MAYTNIKFVEVQEEELPLPSTLHVDELIQTYSILEDVRVGDGRKGITYTISVNERV